MYKKNSSRTDTVDVFQQEEFFTFLCVYIIVNRFAVSAHLDSLSLSLAKGDFSQHTVCVYRNRKRTSYRCVCVCVCVAWNRFRLELDALRLRRSRTGNLEMELTRDQPKQTGMGKTTKQVHTLPFFAPIYAVEKIWNFSLSCKNKIIFHWGKNLTIAVACCSFSTSLVVFIYICTTRKSLPTSVSKLVCVFWTVAMHTE